MNITPATCERLKRAVNPQRLVETALRLIAVPSPTGEAGAVADCLAELLEGDGFPVSRPAGGYPKAPAVVVRFQKKAATTAGVMPAP